MEDRIPLLERPDKVNNDDDDDEDFDPLEETDKDLQDFELEWEKTKTPSGLFEEQEQIKERLKELEKKRLEFEKKTGKNLK